MQMTILIILNVAFLMITFILLYLQLNKKNESSDFFKALVDFGDNQKHFQSKEFDLLKNRLDQKITDGLSQSQIAINQVMQRLVKIDSAQAQMKELGHNVLDLQNILTDKKGRGIFGEVQLSQILINIFGETQGKYYSLQYKFNNQRIADAVLFLPEPMGVIAVDSKFPLENYRRMVDKTLSLEEVKLSTKEFVKNVKTHIDHISSRYIIRGETGNQAILFLPAEAIFSHLHAHHSEVIEYANRKKVWITSPTTFMATLTSIQGILMQMERSKNINILHEEINKLGLDFKRYALRIENLERHFETTFKDLEKVSISSRKLCDRFEKIMSIEDIAYDKKEGPDNGPSEAII